MILYFPIKKATQLSLFDRMNLPTKQVLVHEKSGKTHMQGYHVGNKEKPVTKELTPSDDYKANGVRSRAFKAWFGDWENDPEHASKVVDKDGNPKEMKPIPVFHGTVKEFDEFKKECIGSRCDKGFFGSGFYFTDRKHAEYYGSEESGGKLISVYLNIRNPFIIGIDDPYGISKLSKETTRRFKKAFPGKTVDSNNILKFIMYDIGSDKFTERLKKLGYDGVLSNMGINGRDEWVAFEPNQIKSVDNSGEFNPADNNIYKALRGIR